MKKDKKGRKNIMKKTSRRSFLKSASLLGGSLFGWGILGTPKKASGMDFSGHPDRFGMLTDLTRCMGCRRCEEACMNTNNLPTPQMSFEDKSVFEKKRRTDAQTYTVVNRYYESLWVEGPVYSKVQCNHCEEPACASACLVGALKKTPAGPVVYDEKVCIGCRYCINACPFYIPTYEYSNAFHPKVQKCFMCNHKINRGEVPACSGVCPVEAITFGKRNQLISLARNRISTRPDRYIDHIYGEHEAGGTGWLYISGVPFERLDFPTNLGKTSFPEFTKEFLAFVPLVLVVWPTLLGGIYLFSKRRDEDSEGDQS
ncbi:MAG: 4Fe-4S dicluster domain-containing protein [Desulfobacteraceae bacterium]|nr:MAG: 4Fe-4S dicluster domain-containing protein [Desulfobacteraceae bacterium]